MSYEGYIDKGPSMRVILEIMFIAALLFLSFLSIFYIVYSVYYSQRDGELHVTEPRLGMYCCARYSEDNCWTRARIIKLLPPQDSGKT